MDLHRRLGISRSEFEDVEGRLYTAGFEGREYRYLPDAHRSLDALLDHFESMGLHLLVREDRTDGGERVITFEKRLCATTDRPRAYLDGKIGRE